MNRLGVSMILLAAVGGDLVAQQPPRNPQPGDTIVGTAVLRQHIGLDANPKTSSDYRHPSWSESIELMRTTSANHFHYAKLWSEIERQPGVYDLDDVRFIIEESKPLPLAFNLRVVDAGARNMPDAYKGLAWDSAEMIDHISTVVDRLAPILGTRPWSYAIGNEIDMYFASRPGEIGPYARMLDRVKGRVKASHPRTSFTTSFQFAAAAQLRSLYAPIVAVLDHVAFTYYPLAADFTVRPEASVGADLQAMVAAAQPHLIYLQEIGYPTSAVLGSSPERQRTFVQLAFEAIRAAGSNRVLGATYLFQADLPEWLVAEIARVYGTNSERFRQFVATLGLRDERNRPKPAWDEFVKQAEAIGPRR